MLLYVLLSRILWMVPIYSLGSVSIFYCIALRILGLERWLISLSLSLSLFIFEIGSHCISVCPGTHYGDRVDPELTEGSQFFDRGFCLPQSYTVQSQRNTQNSTLIMNWLAYYLGLLINSSFYLTLAHNSCLC